MPVEYSVNQRYQRIVADDEELLRAAIVRLAGEYGRYGYRRVTALLRAELSFT